MHAMKIIQEIWETKALGKKKISPRCQAAAHFSAQQLMLIVGVKGDNRSSPPSTGLQASASAPASAQKANLLRDANGGSAAAPHPHSESTRPGDELPHPSTPCFFCTASTGPAAELFWVEAASFGEASERSPCSFCTTRWPEEITLGG